MRLALLMTSALFSWAILGEGVIADTGSSDALAEARILLAGRDYEKAGHVLEDALVEADSKSKAEIIALLRQTYRNLITQAEEAGKSREAAAYRDNLAILEQAPAIPPDTKPKPESRQPLPLAAPMESEGGKTARPPEQKRLPRSAQAIDLPLLEEPAPMPAPGPLPTPDRPASALPAPKEIKPLRSPAPQRASRTPLPMGEPSRDQTSSPTIERSASQSSPERMQPQREPLPDLPLESAKADPVETALNQADRLFTTKKYEEAGRGYARLAAQNQLPVERKDVWAYCRWVSVVNRINAHPRSDKEWDEIEQEIRSIQRLTPGNWYGKYLQNRVAEARRASRSSSRTGRLVVRGSAPEEASPSKLARLLGRSGSSSPSSPKAVTSPDAEQALNLPSPTSPGGLPQDADQEGAAGTGARSRDRTSDLSNPTKALAAGPRAGETADPPADVPLTWQVHETANFTIYHTDSALAAEAAKAAEAVRSQQAKRWGSTATRATWTPRCDLYLYPTPRDFARMTGQPETSPGFSTMGVSAGRISARRVNLCADHPQLLTAILPHEVTHVVLADLFTQHQIPRWADEGMAVLSEPQTEQHSRTAELSGPLSEGRVFKLSELMAIDYPNADAWSLYYAQSVSLTQFLVELGTPQQFVSFIRGAQQGGIENSLRTVYQIEGFAELENRWQNFARRRLSEITASNRDTNGDPDGSRRR
jgi:hypothetical protein